MDIDIINILSLPLSQADSSPLPQELFIVLISETVKSAAMRDSTTDVMIVLPREERSAAEWHEMAASASLVRRTAGDSDSVTHASSSAPYTTQ